ncbi:hypothetical protein V2W30_38185 [Streptomyces sp. Q6]|uniref:Uncharacterized protein n=1 Tax=Streptomyces citrinus TaxID=3118173 RepID=A0ACD5AS11_9ACTN
MSDRAGEVFRIDWLPGTDVLSGRCHCGAAHTCEDPVAMWEWMLAHPDHTTAPVGATPEEDRTP